LSLAPAAALRGEPECALHAAGGAAGDAAASRAFFKLGEALARTGETGAVRGACALDVGAAPGGWSQNLVARGAREVLAVDPAPLDAALLAAVDPARLRHVALTIQAAVPRLLAEGRARGVGVYVCDMVYQPETCPVAVLKACRTLLAPRALCIVTLKGAPGHSPASVERAFAPPVAAFRALCPDAKVPARPRAAAPRSPRPPRRSWVMRAGDARGAGQVLHLLANRERERTLVGRLAD
jgi:hypothetical protein